MTEKYFVKNQERFVKKKNALFNQSKNHCMRMGWYLLYEVYWKIN